MYRNDMVVELHACVKIADTDDWHRKGCVCFFLCRRWLFSLLQLFRFCVNRIRCVILSVRIACLRCCLIVCIDVCLTHAYSLSNTMSLQMATIYFRIVKMKKKKKRRMPSAEPMFVHRFSQSNAHCDGTGEWSVFNNILRSFVQQYINYCKAIPLTYECIWRRRRKKKYPNKFYAPRSSPSPTTGTNCLSAERTCTASGSRTRLSGMMEKKPERKKKYSIIPKHRYGANKKNRLRLARSLHIRRWQYPNK